MLEGGQGGVFALLEKNVRMSGYSDEAMIWGLWGTAGSVENQERYLQDHGIEGEGGKELGGKAATLQKSFSSAQISFPVIKTTNKS